MRNGEHETGTYYDCFDALQLSGLRRGCQIAPYRDCPTMFAGRRRARYRHALAQSLSAGTRLLQPAWFEGSGLRAQSGRHHRAHPSAIGECCAMTDADPGTRDRTDPVLPLVGLGGAERPALSTIDRYTVAATPCSTSNQRAVGQDSPSRPLLANFAIRRQVAVEPP
jgi:hypothetical protein